MMDGLALGETTPGPLIIVVAFVVVFIGVEIIVGIEVDDDSLRFGI
jgi:hypothetical protein